MGSTKENETGLGVLVGHGRVVHEATSAEWPSLTLCGREWTDWADGAFPDCKKCAKAKDQGERG